MTNAKFGFRIILFLLLYQKIALVLSQYLIIYACRFYASDKPGTADEIAVLKAQLEARRTGGGGARSGASAALASPTSALNSSMMQNVDTLLEEEVVVVEKLVSKTIDVTDEIVQQKREEARAQIEQIQDAALRERELLKLKQSEVCGGCFAL